MYKKGMVLVIICLFIGASVVPIISAQFTEVNANNEFQKTGKNGGLETEMATVYIRKYDQQNGKLVKEPIMEITRSEAEQIKEELLNIEKTCSSSEEKIREQLRVMHEWNIIPSNITFDEFVTVMERMASIRSSSESISNIKPVIKPLQFVVPGTIILGPSIVSFFSIGGISYPLHLFLPGLLQPIFMERLFGEPIENKDLLNGTTLDGWVGVMPVYVPLSSASAFIAVAGSVISGPQMVFSPFIAIQVPAMGISIDVTILEDIYPVTVFDWCINAGLIGVVIYISETSIP